MKQTSRNAFLAILLSGIAGTAEANSTDCRQALALGLDVSGSVDALEYRLQLDGLASALGTPAVKNALLAMPSAPIQLLVYEWSGATDQHLIADWTAIETAADISILQETLRQVLRREAAPGTALGPSMRTGAAHLDRRPHCWKRTLDISGDGKANSGDHPKGVRAELEAKGITLNALVIGADTSGLADLKQAELGELSSYFRVNVITGPDAFVQTALGYEEYAQAMARKLERELEGLVVSSLFPEN
ncbi:MAG: DUF1194 domain-containing protein [Aliishimia sp.]